MAKKKKSVFLAPGDKLWQTLQSVALDEGLEIYDIEKTRGGLRVFIELASSAAQQKHITEGNGDRLGVTSQDCSRFCRRLMVLFSVEGEQFGLSVEPEIEVSSPGINRHLRLKDHFVRAVGSRVRVKSNHPEQGGGISSLVSGNLAEVEDEMIRIIDERTKTPVEISFDGIQDARVDFRFL